MADRGMKDVVSALVICALLVASPVAMAEGYIDDSVTPEAMLADGLLVRPLGLCGLVLGTATWIVTLPFSLLGGNVGEATDALVVEPAKFTFVRPLGDL
jgi:hypothetical protein